VWRILLQLGEVVHLGLGAGGVVDGEQEHTCEGEEGKEEGRTGENCARVPPALSPSAPTPVRSAVAALSPAPPGEVACSRGFFPEGCFRAVGEEECPVMVGTLPGPAQSNSTS
jgi:hypothetical protein